MNGGGHRWPSACHEAAVRWASGGGRSHNRMRSHAALLVICVIGLTAGSPATASTCAGLRPPVDGEIIGRFVPVGRFGGHWGTDFVSSPGSPVGAAAAGTVTFAGSVAGTRSVTVDHGGGVRTSYSYLATTSVRRGDSVVAGTTVGTAGTHRGVDAVHLSLRRGDTYLDPEGLLRCFLAPGAGLRLEPVATRHPAYPSTGATWNPRRNLRPTSSGSPRRRRIGLSRPRPRCGDVHPRRRAVAEGGPGNVRAPAPLGDDQARRAQRRLLRGGRA